MTACLMFVIFRCELFFKLFVVMGTTWIFQVILAVFEEDAVSIWHSIGYAVLDLTNVFQAVAIFVIFVCKRETVRALEQKYFCFKCTTVITTRKKHATCKIFFGINCLKFLFRL